MTRSSKQLSRAGPSPRPRRTLLFSLLLFAWIVAQALSTAPPLTASPGTAPDLLSVAITSPPRWEKGCLSFSIDRTNRAAFPLYIPYDGLDIDMSVGELADLRGSVSKFRWENIVGVSDLLMLDARALPPGDTIHEDICLPPSIGIGKREGATHRQIPLRGSLRLSAYYYLSREDWRTSIQAIVRHIHTTPDQWNPIVSHPPETTVRFERIPCHEQGCGPTCTSPPKVLKDEGRVIPDVVQDDPYWLARGHALELDLAGRFPTCSEDRTESPYRIAGPTGP